MWKAYLSPVADNMHQGVGEHNTSLIFQILI